MFVDCRSSFLSLFVYHYGREYKHRLITTIKTIL